MVKMSVYVELSWIASSFTCVYTHLWYILLLNAVLIVRAWIWHFGLTTGGCVSPARRGCCSAAGRCRGGAPASRWGSPHPQPAPHPPPPRPPQLPWSPAETTDTHTGAAALASRCHSSHTQYCTPLLTRPAIPHSIPYSTPPKWFMLPFQTGMILSKTFLNNSPIFVHILYMDKIGELL